MSSILICIYFNLDCDCGTKTSGDREACKNCTCGLAKELKQAEQATFPKMSDV